MHETSSRERIFILVADLTEYAKLAARKVKAAGIAGLLCFFYIFVNMSYPNLGLLFLLIGILFPFRSNAEISEFHLGVISELTGPLASIGAVCGRGIEMDYLSVNLETQTSTLK